MKKSVLKDDIMLCKVFREINEKGYYSYKWDRQSLSEF